MDRVLSGRCIRTLHTLLCYKLSTWYNNLSNSLSSAQNEIRQAGWIKKCEFHGSLSRLKWYKIGIRISGDDIIQQTLRKYTEYAIFDRWRARVSFRGRQWRWQWILHFFPPWMKCITRIEFPLISFDGNDPPRRKPFELNKHSRIITQFIHREARSLN